ETFTVRPIAVNSKRTSPPSGSLTGLMDRCRSCAKIDACGHSWSPPFGFHNSREPSDLRYFNRKGPEFLFCYGTFVAILAVNLQFSIILKKLRGFRLVRIKKHRFWSQASKHIGRKRNQDGIVLRLS